MAPAKKNGSDSKSTEAGKAKPPKVTQSTKAKTSPKKPTDKVAATSKEKTAAPAKTKSIKTVAAKSKATAEKKTSPKAKAVPAVKAAPKAAATRSTAKANPPESVPEVKPPAKGTTRKSAAIPAATVEAMREVEQRERELPLEYGDTKVVLLTRDPEWIFAYWEINSSARKKFGLQRGAHNKSLALRVYTLSSHSHVPTFDVPVNDYTSSWYIRVPRGGSRFRVELGTYDEKGGFVTVASSNELELPRMEIADSGDLEFAEINDEIYHQIVQLSGGVKLKERLGSDEFLRSLQQRVFETIAGGALSSAGLSSGSFFGLSSGLLSSGAFGLSSGLLSSAALSSAGLFSAGVGGEGMLHTAGKERRSDFWLEVGVDVIVYGATEPDAKVTFMGQEIRLTPDGTFRVRMVLPDTTIEFPIDAISADGEHKRAVKPVVRRHTEGDPRKPL